MKVTLFTSNHLRHNRLSNRLTELGHDVFVVSESTTIHSGKVPDRYLAHRSFEKYFSHVTASEVKYFGHHTHLINPKAVLNLKCGDLDLLDESYLDGFLNSDRYICFGSSYIKGWLIDFLMKNRCLNIHMGLSPFYRGSSCNFWAIYDCNYDYVGSTLHLLSRGLDSGPIVRLIPSDLYGCETMFDFSMKAVLLGQDAALSLLLSDSYPILPVVQQDPQALIRYSKNSDFSLDVVENFLSMSPPIEAAQECLHGLINQPSHPVNALNSTLCD